MSKQMITFSFRTTPESVRGLKKEARNQRKSCGALLREMLFKLNEDGHEIESCESDFDRDGISPGGGMQSDQPSN